MKNTINYGAILAPALLFSACGTGQKRSGREAAQYHSYHDG